jgi:hypothetical protein
VRVYERYYLPTEVETLLACAEKAPEEFGMAAGDFAGRDLRGDGGSRLAGGDAGAGRLRGRPQWAAERMVAVSGRAFRESLDFARGCGCRRGGQCSALWFLLLYFH